MASLERDLRELDALRNRGVITPEEYEVRRAALMAAPPAPPRPRGNVVLEVFKWGSVGCLVVIGVGFLVSVLLVIAIVAAISNSEDQTADSGADIRVTLSEGVSGEVASGAGSGEVVAAVGVSAMASSSSLPAVERRDTTLKPQY